MSVKQIYAVLGHPVAHSLSPKIHQTFAQEYGINLSYNAIDVAPDNFTEFINNFFINAFGANVTVPFKQQAFTVVEQTSERAKYAKAVNTIKKMANGSLLGDNTDGIGLVTDLTNNLNFSLINKTILLLGAGGAARGVILPILQQQPKQLIITNRTFSKAEQLVQQFNQVGTIDAIKIDKLTQPVDLIINATSASLAGELPILANSLIAPQHSCCYDMMYGKKTTIFNNWAQQHGAKYCWDGLGMLVEQAAASFALWHDVQPSTTEVLQELRQLTE